MLKRRLIGCIVVRDGIAVQSIGFQRYLPIGSPAVSAQHLNRWGIDEIVLQDISATQRGSGPDLKLVETVAAQCFVPLAVAGGIASVDDVRRVLRSGADKIVVNATAVAAPSLIADFATVFGRQCVVASVDAKPVNCGRYEVFTHSGDRPTGRTPDDVAAEMEHYGAGEILLGAIHRDGHKTGYDRALIASVAGAISIPLIISGGVGRAAHFVEGLQIPGVSAVAAGNNFHFTEHSATVAKAAIANAGFDIRTETYADYRHHGVDEVGRLLKQDDRDLERMFFQYFPKEVI